MSTLSRLSLEENRELQRQMHATNIMRVHATYQVHNVVGAYLAAARQGEGIPDDFEILPSAQERAWNDVFSFLLRLDGCSSKLVYELEKREYQTNCLLGHELWFYRVGFAGFSKENWGLLHALILGSRADHLGAVHIYRDDANYTFDIY